MANGPVIRWNQADGVLPPKWVSPATGLPVLGVASPRDLAVGEQWMDRAGRTMTVVDKQTLPDGTVVVRSRG